MTLSSQKQDLGAFQDCPALAELPSGARQEPPGSSRDLLLRPDSGSDLSGAIPAPRWPQFALPVTQWALTVWPLLLSQQP